MTKQDR